VPGDSFGIVGRGGNPSPARRRELAGNDEQPPPLGDQALLARPLHVRLQLVGPGEGSRDGAAPFVGIDIGAAPGQLDEQRQRALDQIIEDGPAVDAVAVKADHGVIRHGGLLLNLEAVDFEIVRPRFQRSGHVEVRTFLA
jgi:hypothetical protein